jgi:signal transduction histidine kinase
LPEALHASDFRGEAPEMTPINMGNDQYQQVVLGDILHIIATTDEPRDCLPPILDSALRAVDAVGGCILLFGDPQMLVVSGALTEDTTPPGDTLRSLAESLPAGVHRNPPLPADFEAGYTGWLLCPLLLKDEVVGALWLVFEDNTITLVDDQATLFMLLDGLVIVVKQLHAAARQEKLSRNQSEFMRIVSHDLRSPLTSIQGFAGMLESEMVGDLNEQQSHFVEKILSGITQMTSLVDNIQDAGRFDPETGFYDMERSQCDLVDLVQRIVKNHLVPAEKQDLTITMTAVDGLPIINVDVNMLERAIANLIDNAIKYTPNGRKIAVGLDRQGDNLFLSVKDNGLGINPEHQKLLFERHVRIARREHKRVKGSGLGLFIVRSVARSHGGDAWVESVEGQGSTFYIRIPLNDANSIVSGSAAP